jgi:DegV family protein with EDD domain
VFDIITDSACDMPKDYYEKNEVVCVKLGFMMNDVDYEGEDGVQITEQEFFKVLREGAMPTTYQVTGERARDNIERSVRAGRDVLVLTFSSGLSGTAGSFIVAARELAKEYPDRKIRVVDGLSASMGQGLLLHYLLRKADSGATLDETADYVEDMKLKIGHHFTVDNLFHLHRGGRVSKATAIVGTVLKIKPLLHVDDEGHLIAIGKAMGRKKALHMVVENLLANADLGKDDPVFISHGDCIEDVEYVKTLIRAKYPDVEIVVNYLGAVIGAHAGANTVALFCKATKR